MSQQIFKYLRKIDVFGTKVTLNYNKESQYRTLFGGFMTFSMIFGIFFIAASKTPVQLEPCTQDHFKHLPQPQLEWGSKFDEMNLKDYLCLQKGKEYLIGGKWENENFYHIKFTVKQCVNSTSQIGTWQPVCDTPQNIQKAMGINSYVNFVMSNFFINPENSTQPTTQYFHSMIFSLQPNAMYSTSNVMLNEQIINTDNTIFSTPSISEEKYVVYSQGDFQQQTIVGNFPTYSEVYFLRSSFSSFIRRSYLKLGDVISYIGGFAQVFILISAVSVFTVELANRLYDFDVVRDPKQVVIRNEKNLKERKRKEDLDRQKNKTTNQLKKRLSLANDGKVIDREDHGLIPLQQIKQSLIEKIGYSKNNEQFQMSTFSRQNDQINQSKFVRLKDKEETIFNDISYSPRQSPQMQIFQENNYPQADSFQLEDNILKIENDQQQKNFVLDYKRDKDQEFDDKSVQFEREGDHLENDIKQIPFYQETKQKNNQQFMNNLSKFSQKQILQSDSASTISKISKRNQVVPLNDTNSSPLNRRQNMESDQNIMPKINQNSSQKGTQNTKQFLEQEIKFIVQRNREVQLTFKFVLNKLTCGKFFKTREVLLLKKAEKMVTKDLDIFTILDKMKQLDKLKMLILSKQQETLFNFFPKPFISIAESKNELNLEQLKNESMTAQVENNKNKNQRKNNKQILKSNQLVLIAKVVNRFKNFTSFQYLNNYQQLFECYEYLIHQNRTKAEAYQNQKLIDLLGNELKNIFEIAELQINTISFNKGQYYQTPHQANLNHKNLFYRMNKVQNRTSRNAIPKQSLFSQDNQPILQIEGSQEQDQSKIESFQSIKIQDQNKFEGIKPKINQSLDQPPQNEEIPEFPEKEESNSNVE